MSQTQDEFVHHRNVAIYMRQLRYAPNAVQRGLLMSRLAGERVQAVAHGWAGYGRDAAQEICTSAVVGLGRKT